MLKTFITFILLISFVSTFSQQWSANELNTIQQFSLKHLKQVSDPSNKYINNTQAIKLGKLLFNDKRLSSNGEVACKTCHIKKNAFTDNKKIAKGLREGFRNTPTLFNIAYQDWFFADGSKDNLWSQTLSSMENPAEQNFTRVELLHLVTNDVVYQKAYHQIFRDELPNKTELGLFPDKAGPNAKLEHLLAWKQLSKKQRHKTNIVFTNIGKSIAAFVATIKAEKSRFDLFVEDISKNSKSERLNASEQRGLRLFIQNDSGCMNCHNGPLFSNKSFHNIATGIPGKDNGRSEIIDSVIRDEFNCLGKYSDAKADECLELNYINRDKHLLVGSYKTSTLRGIGKTAPYMHDGRFTSLLEVIDHYVLMSQKKPSHTDLSPTSLTEEQKIDLVNFLLTL